MNPYDALFLALGLTVLTERTPHRAWLAAAPLLAWVSAGWLPDGLREPMLGVLLACCLPRLTPAAFLLAAPRYADGLEALRASAGWLLVLGLLQGVEGRAATAPISPRWRGAPLRLMVCAVLHATLLPLRYLS